MKKVSLLKPLLLLFALIVGSSSAWADDYTITFLTASGDGTAVSTSTACSDIVSEGSSYLSGNVVTANNVYYAGASGLKLGKSSASGTIKMNLASSVTPTSIVVNAKLYNASKPTTLKVNGSATQDITSDFTDLTFDITTSISSIELVSSKYCWIKSITVYYSTGVFVAAPTFSLAAGKYKGTQSVTITTNEAGGTTYYTIDGTTPDNTKTVATASPISITETTTLKAITYKGENSSAVASATYNIFNVTDGLFDFVTAAEMSEDYGSGLSTTSDGSFYVEEAKTWTAGNVTMVTDGKYRWWAADGTLRFYSNTPKSSATFSVPSGYVITKIETLGGNFSSASNGTLSGNTWTGASQNVKLESGAINLKKITVTYLPENVTITPAKEYTTYVTPAAMDFTGVSGLKAFVATAADGTGVTLTEPAAAVPANTPLVLKKVSGTSFSVPVVASATAPATNMLKAGPATMTGDGTEYILIDGLFYQSTAGALATGKAYLKTASALGRELTINWGDETAINTLENATKIDNGAIYDLSGRRVENPTKGIYIINGKKVIFK